MLTQLAGQVLAVDDERPGLQKITVQCGDEQRLAMSYTDLVGPVVGGDTVLLNTTAQSLQLGTGGYDFVVAKLNDVWHGARGAGHIVKGRYLPCQQAVLTLEEQPEHAPIWERRLEALPVLVGQLHSQIAPAAAGLKLAGKERVVYVMTDAGALPLVLSRLVSDLKTAGLLAGTITCGQAFGGDFETVTLHSALLAAKHILDADAIIVCQGPGNAGTGTKYGFSGVEQAQNLDIVSALGGTAVAIVRMSSADGRARHQGISHHTHTALELVHAACLAPLPVGADAEIITGKHTLKYISGCESAVALLKQHGIRVTTMGRSYTEDPLFFAAAAAAGLATANQFIEDY